MICSASEVYYEKSKQFTFERGMMASATLGIFGYALFPAIAIPLGSVIAIASNPGDKTRSMIQHFTAGVVFAALATELLPDLVHRRMPFVTLIGFGLGVAVMLGMKSLAEKIGENKISDAGQPTSLIVVLGMDVALDGVLIGLGFAAGQKQGLLLTIALSLEVLFLGVSASAALGKAKASRTRILLVAAGFALLLLLGALIGAMVLNTVSGAILDAILAFGVAALLYLVTEELLVEAHETPETPIQAAMFFVGFIALLTFEMLI